jgi:hypothetical protein
MILYKRRDEEKRRVFTKFRSKKQVKDLVFGAESGINHQDIKEYAWPEKGVKIIRDKSGAVRHRRTIVIAAICCGKIIAPYDIHNCTNIDNLCVWSEKVLCSELRPGQIVIRDNASFHKSLIFAKLSNMSAVNWSTYCPLRRTSAASSTSGRGSKINFPVFGVT